MNSRTLALALTALSLLVGCSQSPKPETSSATPSAPPREATQKRSVSGRRGPRTKAQAFERRLERDPEFRAKVDTDGDGTISPAEHAQGLANFKPREHRRGKRRKHRDRDREAH